MELFRSAYGCIVTGGEFVEVVIPRDESVTLKITMRVTVGETGGSECYECNECSNCNATWTSFRMSSEKTRRSSTKIKASTEIYAGRSEVHGLGTHLMQQFESLHSGGLLSSYDLSTSEQLSIFSDINLLLMSSHYDEDLTWLSSQIYPHVIYTKKPFPIDMDHADENLPFHDLKHHVPHNVGGEATAYLKFIIDYYEHLPRSILFLHGHRYAYHQEDLLILLNQIRQRDYVDSYCNINSVAWGTLGENNELLARHWEEWIGGWLGEMPETEGGWIFDRCCAQFIVGRERIRRYPKRFYEEALEVMYREGGEGKEESRKVGLVMEWIWGYIFGGGVLGEGLERLVEKIGEVEQVSLRDRSWCFE